MLMCVIVSVTIHTGLGGARLLLPGSGSAQAGKLSTMGLFPSVLSLLVHFGKQGSGGSR